MLLIPVVSSANFPTIPSLDFTSPSAIWQSMRPEEKAAFLMYYWGFEESPINALRVYEVAPGWEQINVTTPDFTSASNPTLSDDEADSTYSPIATLEYSQITLVMSYSTTSTSSDGDIIEGPLVVEVCGFTTATWLSPAILGTYHLSSDFSVVDGSVQKAWAIDLSDINIMPYMGVRVINKSGEEITSVVHTFIGRP